MKSYIPEISRNIDIYNHVKLHIFSTPNNLQGPCTDGMPWQVVPASEWQSRASDPCGALAVSDRAKTMGMFSKQFNRDVTEKYGII